MMAKMPTTWSHAGGILGIMLSALVAIWWMKVAKLHANLTLTSNVPMLTRLDPIEVGHVHEIRLVSGKTLKIKTLSMRPTLFEIEKFLSDDECDDIIFMAATQGLERSQTIVSKVKDFNDTLIAQILSRPEDTFKAVDANNNGVLEISELASGMSFLGDIMMTNEAAEQLVEDLSLDVDKNNLISFEEFKTILKVETLQKITKHTDTLKAGTPKLEVRVSNTAFISPLDHGGMKQLFENIKQRIQQVTGLPKDIIWTSEDMQVLRYDTSGHYHCHYDSEEEEDYPDVTCCHYFNTDESNDSCIPCRYITFFYYLNEPEEGGETAFPIADNDTSAVEMMRGDQHHLCDLSNYCHKAKIAYKPKRGTALFWYNHEMNKETGWIGPLDRMSYHGGCDVIKGTKWAANNWINVGKSREKDIQAWAQYKEFVDDYDKPKSERLSSQQSDDIVQNDEKNKQEKDKAEKENQNRAEKIEKEDEERR